MAILIRLVAALAIAALLVPVAGDAQTFGHARAHRTITTSSPDAQAAFDRGLAFLYAFNIGAARESFASVEKFDRLATLGYVGEALTETFDINLSSTYEGELRGAAVVKRGRAIAVHAPEDERSLLAALEVRFDLHRTQEQRFRSFFDAMQAYVREHPSDDMGLTVAADAGWNAVGDVLDAKGQQTADAQKIAADLDAALAIDPDNLGAHHLRIHFWENANDPSHALADADALAALTYDPGESHLTHMAGHTYTRVGNFEALVATNEAACANDVAYFAAGNGPGQDYMRTYHDHDVDFVLYGLTSVGRNAEARAFVAHEDVDMQRMLALRLHDRTRLRALGVDRFGDARSRAIHEARAGNLAAADRDARELLKLPENQTGLLRGILALERGDLASAVIAYRTAYEATKANRYLGDPKNSWETPIGEGYGAVLLRTKAFATAEAVFRAELKRYPNDPHLYFGLAEALVGQGKDDTGVRASYTQAWKGDTPLSLADLG